MVNSVFGGKGERKGKQRIRTEDTNRKGGERKNTLQNRRTGMKNTDKDYCRLPRYLTKPRQRRSEWDMAGSDGISRVSTVFRGKSLLTNKMRII